VWLGGRYRANQLKINDLRSALPPNTTILACMAIRSILRDPRH